MSFRFLLAVAFCTVAFSAFAQSASDVDVVVPAHDIARGAVISDTDLSTKPFPAVRLNDGIIRNTADAVGREAKRALRAGEILRTNDLKRPALVAKGATVTMVFEAPGMKLSSVGRALAEGGEGDTISVINPTSYRQVIAVVIAPGTVRVGAADSQPKTAVAAARQ
jgi:flagella basal body P-ring formation protein FlgA